MEKFFSEMKDFFRNTQAFDFEIQYSNYKDIKRYLRATGGIIFLSRGGDLAFFRKPLRWLKNSLIWLMLKYIQNIFSCFFLGW